MEFKDISADMYIGIIKNKLPKVLHLLEPSSGYCAFCESVKVTKFDLGSSTGCTVISFKRNPDDEFVEVKFIVNHHPKDEYVWYFKVDDNDNMQSDINKEQAFRGAQEGGL